MSRSKRDQILRERDRLAPFLERAFNLSESDLVAMEAEAAKGKGRGALEHFLKSVDTVGLPNPLVSVSDFDREYPHYHVLKVMRNPDYFPLTCKILYDIDLEPFQHAVLKVMWRKLMVLLAAGRGVGKSWLLALYAHLKMLFQQGSKVVIVGAAFRQSKVIFEYMDNMWSKASILRDLLGDSKGRSNRNNGPRRDVDRCDMLVGDSIASALPVGPDGSKIRGQRANTVICDEFASVSEEVFNNVVIGFGSVRENPIQQARETRKVRALKAMDLWDDADEKRHRENAKHNQVILAGTADYAFGHFSKTYHKWKAIIQSGGDPRKLEAIYPEGVPTGLDHRDYACIRLPFTVLPAGYMDEKMIGVAKGKLSRAQFLREYAAVFVEDSSGFYRRSLIEACTVGKPSSPVRINDADVIFYPAMRGVPNTYHVIAVDPASERDKLAITVIAMCGNHRRVVHVWTTDRKSHEARKSLQLNIEGDYYRFAAAKIRSLMNRFPATRLAIDGQGGGIAVMEALANPTDPAEQPIYPVMDPPGTASRKPTDHKPGLHIIEVIQFANAEWTAEANHSLKADFEQQKLLFPLWDTASEELALNDDKTAGRIRIVDGQEVQTEDTLLDIVNDIEELKDELTSIVHTILPSGRDRWDVPEIKLESGKKGRQRKDRYSALLMANKVARDIMNAEEVKEYESYGSVKGRAGVKSDEPPSFFSRKPGWIKADHMTGRMVTRKRS